MLMVSGSPVRMGILGCDFDDTTGGCSRGPAVHASSERVSMVVVDDGDVCCCGDWSFSLGWLDENGA
jgi:hypothetical protein